MRLNQFNISKKMIPEVITINETTQIKTERYSYPNGNVSSKIYYKNGEKHGLETWWGKSGQKRLKAMWKDGKEHGLTIAWNEDGTKNREEMMKDDKSYGLDTRWGEDGQKKQEIYYIEGDMAGIEYASIQWDEKGNVNEIYLPPKPDNKSEDQNQRKTTLKGNKLVYV